MSACAGCWLPARSTQRGDEFGRTYYIDGAGNWGFGVAQVRAGLRDAGYQGAIINFLWSPTFNPVLDQTVGRPVARLKGRELAEQITRYRRQYPNNDVNIIALSAGTGVAVWACEALEEPGLVHNLVLLGSSLSCDYDMTDALARISGAVYVYHSPNDAILNGPVRTLGTIDGKLGEEPAGRVGLRSPRGDRDRIINTPWSPRFERYGWRGAHTDATNSVFVRQVLSKHIVVDTQKLASGQDDMPAVPSVE